MNKKIFLTSFLSLTFLFAGCDNDVQEMDMNSDGQVPLNIVIGGKEDFGDISSPETRSAETTVQSFVQPLDSTQNTGIDIVTTVEMVPSEEKAQTRANMEDNAPFDVAIFDMNGNSVAYSRYKIQGTSAIWYSGDTPILTPGTYKFVCFTYNQKYGPVGGTDISVWPGDDFSTYCVTKNITAIDNTLNIVFKRQMSQVEVAINSNIGGTASFTTAESSSFYSGMWAADFNSTDDTKIRNVDLMNGIRFDSPNYIIPVSKTASFTLNNVTIGGKNYGTKTVNVPVSFVKRGNYKITIHFEKSYPYTEINGVKWAVSNLSYINGQVTVNSRVGENYNLLFCGGSLLGYDIAKGVNAGPVVKPSEYSGSPVIKNSPRSVYLTQNPSNGTGDPCTYYLGTSWRVPTQQEVYALGGVPDNNGRLANSVWRTKGTYGLQYANGVFMGPYAASARISGNTVTNNSLFIPANGYYFNLENKINDLDKRGSFWTSAAYGGLLGYVGAGHLVGYGKETGYYIHNDIGYGFGVRCVHK